MVNFQIVHVVGHLTHLRLLLLQLDFSEQAFSKFKLNVLADMLDDHLFPLDKLLGIRTSRVNAGLMTFKCLGLEKLPFEVLILNFHPGPLDLKGQVLVLESLDLPL